MITRRGLIAASGAAAASVWIAPIWAAPAFAAAETGLTSLATDAQPISLSERRQRVAKAQDLMSQRGWGGLLVEAGSTLEYFTGVRWRRSERTTAAIIPAVGAPIVVCPFFEEPSIRETLALGEVRTWNEADSPFETLAGALRDRGGAGRPLAVEQTTRFFVLDGVRRAAGVEVVGGESIVRACRLYKSPAELALMQTANDITLAALKYVHGAVETGMSSADIAGLMDKTTAALGGDVEFSMVLLNEASAFPHGSDKPQKVVEGSVILMDCGCAVHGYQSDISRTWIHGAATPRQRQVWNTVKRGQEIALEAAHPGVAAGAVDDAVRRFYEAQGWGPAYRLPGLSHRTGHGIGLDGHEDAYLVHGDATPLEPGMCFSDEPGLYIPGEFGIRLEDCWHMTEAGPKPFTRLARSVEDPI
jgi:Xaa-Pro dipeptidase